MKELSIEEKAKAYDEALHKAKRIINVCVDDNTECRSMIACIQELFPELKESEDERIKGNIIATIHLYYGEPLEDEAKEMIAWLEKQGEKKYIDDLTQQEAMDIAVAKFFEQGEQKSTDKVEPKFKVGDRIKYLKDSGMPFLIEKIENGEYIFGNNMGHTTIESGNTWYLVDTVEQKQVIDYSDSLSKDNWELVHEFVEKFGRIPKDEDELNALVEYVLKRQKTAWSEEDELIISVINALINMAETKTEQWYYNGSKKVFYSDIRQWLKSLKERVQLKQEWSKEDETIAKALTKAANDNVLYGYIGKSKLLEWLKSIRDRYTWKPSDEQIEALLKLEEMHVLEHEKNQENAHLYMVVKSLREQLLKLREE